jgi:hypothetical protein
VSAFSFKHLFVIPDARSAIRNPGANTQPVAPGFRGLRFAEPRNDELLGSFDLFALPHLGPGARACAILVDPVRIKKSKGGTRICHAKECAVGSALIDAANPRPVIGSIGAVAGDVSLSEAARPMACGFVVRHESPVLLPAFSCSAGFSSVCSTAHRRFTLDHIARRIGSNIGQLPSSGAMDGA